MDAHSIPRKVSYLTSRQTNYNLDVPQLRGNVAVRPVQAQ